MAMQLNGNRRWPDRVMRYPDQERLKMTTPWSWNARSLHFPPQMHNTWKCLQSIDGHWLYEAIR